jgi:hypothetical protein
MVSSLVNHNSSCGESLISLVLFLIHCGEFIHTFLEMILWMLFKFLVDDFMVRVS